MSGSGIDGIDNDRLLTTREVAALFGVKPGTIRAWICRGDPRLPEPIRYGRGFVRWRATDLRERLDQIQRGALPCVRVLPPVHESAR